MASFKDLLVNGVARFVGKAYFTGGIDGLCSGDQNSETHDCNSATSNGFYYYSSNGPTTSLGASTTDGGLIVQRYSDNWIGQIAIDYRNGNLFVRGKSNGTWTSWKKVTTS